MDIGLVSMPIIRKRIASGNMPAMYTVGLHSAADNHLSIILWTYHTAIRGLSERISVRDAAEHMPLSTFRNLLEQGAHIAHISDVIRLRALCSTHGGWFWDCDTWVLKPLPLADGKSPKNTHVFGSMAAKPRTSNDSKFWRTDYLREPCERAYLAVPFYFPSESSVLPALRTFTDHLVDSSKITKIKYNAIMGEATSLLVDAGLSIDVQPVEAFCPVHPWITWDAVSKGPWAEIKKTSFGFTNLDVGEMLEASYCVNFPNCTSRHGGVPSEGAAQDVLDISGDCLVGELLTHLAGHSGLPDCIARRIRLDGKLSLEVPVMQHWKRRVVGKKSAGDFVQVLALLEINGLITLSTHPLDVGRSTDLATATTDTIASTATATALYTLTFRTFLTFRAFPTYFPHFPRLRSGFTRLTLCTFRAFRAYFPHFPLLRS